MGAGPAPSPASIFLVAACGSLNPETEGGQRLAVGWWNSDPDESRMKEKAPAEIIWMRVPVQWVEVDTEVWLRDE